LYIIQRGWYGRVIVYVVALFEDKSDVSKDSFYKELDYAFDQFPR
jgi:hypothetical protein